MRAFIINLDSAAKRWAFIQKSFEGTRFVLCRVPAIVGKDLAFPIKEYDEARYRKNHGRTTNPGEVGCYLSHLKACQAFLDSNDEHGLICEDDISLGADFEKVLNAALLYSKHWDILRLTGLSEGQPARVKPLTDTYSLCVSFGRLKGAGIYVLNRAAARGFVSQLLPMWLPYDHAFDREWFQGLRAAYVLPFPGSQTESGTRTSIQSIKSEKLPQFQRYATVYPYQVYNELTRWIFRGFSYLRLKVARTETGAGTCARRAEAIANTAVE